MPPIDLAALEADLATESRSHRDFFLPIVQALDALGGGGRKRDVVAKVRELLHGHLSRQGCSRTDGGSRSWGRTGSRSESRWRSSSWGSERWADGGVRRRRR